MKTEIGEPQKRPRVYAYTSHKRRTRLHLLDSMDSLCEAKGPEAQNRAAYYDSYDFQKTDPTGSYTGLPTDEFGRQPIQDADDL